MSEKKIKKNVRFSLSCKQFSAEKSTEKKNEIPYRQTPYNYNGGVAGNKISRKTRKRRR